MQYLIGIDVGTSGTKTVLYDLGGNEIAAATAEYPLYQEQNGYAEQEPEDWWRAVCETLRAVTAGIDAHEIGGVGLSGQMHGVVLLDKDGAVLRRAIIWCDSRTGEECREITEIVGKERLIAVTANPALAGFSAGKLRWIQKHEPHIYEKCRHILLPKDFIRYKLTSEFATEVSDAAGTQWLDVRARDWSPALLTALCVEKDYLPKVYESPVISACVSARGAADTGLAAGTPVAGGGGDNACAAVGTGVVSGGRAFVTVGTSGVVFVQTDEPRIDPLGRVHTFCAAVPGTWHVMGVTQAAGLSLRWCRDVLCREEKRLAEADGPDAYDRMTALAAASPVGSNRLLYLPYLMGERTPHLDPDARGAFFGLSAMHTVSDMIRAVLEGVAFSLADCLAVFKEMGVETAALAICGGGARSPLWQTIFADVFGKNLTTVSPAAGASLGAALLAGVGCGAYENVKQAADEAVRVTGKVGFDGATHEAYEKVYALYRRLYPALRAEYAALAKL